MSKKIKNVKKNYYNPLPLATGDLMQSTTRLNNLLNKPGIKGLLLLSQAASPIYISISKNPLEEEKVRAIRIVFLLASLGNLFSQVQAIKNEAALPPKHISIAAHPDTEKCINNILNSSPYSTPGIGGALYRSGR